MQPEELYELDTDELPETGGPAAEGPDSDGMALLVYLEGFMDAGAAGRLLTEHLLDAFEHTTVARFNTDRLLDYRSRRPLMTFDGGKWETYDAPELSVFKLADAEGKPFLLLTGPEPDHEWEAFVAAAQSLAERLGAGPMITYFGVPMGIPHTRPLGVITHATRPGLVTSKVALPSKLQVPASASSLMEYRFGEAGKDAIGLVVQVPHYLSQAAYPTAALTLIDVLTEVTGLDLPALELREAADRTNVLIDRQVEESAEVAELVQGLESQYDAAIAHDGENLLAEGEEMPTADELAAQFEQFLAEQNGPED
ncbi:MAG TPA: PAC2 family protein [Trebonia sp.]|nr:PAC2 family protein [Trebonia sp.]